MKDQTLTLCVSGVLWNRSLIMMDTETKSLWSHLLGECVHGKLKGTVLDTIPCEMLTWAAWKKQYPKTTVLNLSRTHKEFTKDIYKTPANFVLGWVVDDQAYSCSMEVLQKQPVRNLTAGKAALVLTFDANSTAARLYSRRVDGQELTLAADKPGFMRDKETDTTWDVTGLAVEGKLKGKRLEAQVGIMSFSRAWKTFHPNGKVISNTN